MNLARHGNVMRMRLMYAPELARLPDIERENLLMALMGAAMWIGG